MNKSVSESSQVMFKRERHKRDLFTWFAVTVTVHCHHTFSLGNMLPSARPSNSGPNLKCNLEEDAADIDTSLACFR
jgi:hypothetical protein